MKDLKRQNSEIVWNVVGVLAAITLVLYLLDSFFGLRPSVLIPVSGGQDQPVVSLPTAALVTPKPTSPAPPTESPAPAATHTALPSPTTARSPESGLTEDPFPRILQGFGPDGIFTLHQLGDGESYTYLASIYDTTVEVLESLNFNKEGKRLWVGQYVVVIPGLTQPRLDLPKFVVLQIEETTSLADIALDYGLLIDQLNHYNQLPADTESVSMRLLLVPILAEE